MNLLVKKGNQAIMTRGDYFRFPVELWAGKFPRVERWLLEDGDFAYFGLMRPNESFENAVIKKELTVENTNRSGDLLVTLYPEDTVNLEPGTYYYEVKVLYKKDRYKEDEQKKDLIIETAVQKTKFTILD